MSLPEPILQENKFRYTLFPIQYPELYNFYKRQLACFWTVEEIDLTKDHSDWNKLTDSERHFIKNVLAFFAGSDGIVSENIFANFAVEVQIPEARGFYSVQNMIEYTHSETYSLLIDTYIKDPVEKKMLFEAIETIPCVSKKARWAMKWMNPKERSFAHRLVAFAIVEGVFFSGSFCSIFWLKSRGIMPGLTFSNELIARDEGLHCDFACWLYKYHVLNKLADSEIAEIIREAVQIETEFICDSLPCKLIGMNSEQMTQYIQFVADRLSVQLGSPKIWGVSNPFPFMDMINLQGKTNFFEKRVSQYQKSGVATGSKSKYVFELEEDAVF